MIKSVHDEDKHLWDVIDLDTGKRIEGVQWANDETGELERILFDEDGSVKTIWNNFVNQWVTAKVKEQRNFKLVRKEG